MNKGKVINLNEYKNKKINDRKNTKNYIDELKQIEEDDRKNTFNLFMRVLSTIREEYH